MRVAVSYYVFVLDITDSMSAAVICMSTVACSVQFVLVLNISCRLPFNVIRLFFVPSAVNSFKFVENTFSWLSLVQSNHETWYKTKVIDTTRSHFQVSKHRIKMSRNITVFDNCR